MLVFEFKTYGKASQFKAIDEAIRTTQFIRNKAIRLWVDGEAKSWVELSRHCSLLAGIVSFCRQAEFNGKTCSSRMSLGFYL